MMMTCKAVAWLGTEDIAVSSDACIYRHNLTRSMFLFFQTESFQSQKDNTLLAQSKASQC
jgi:type I restriction enzyme S subunit